MNKLLAILLLGIAGAASAQPDSSGVWTLVEQMPLFPGCEHFLSTDPAKYTCSEKALAAFISANLQYPDSAIRKNIEGLVVVSFVVDEKGNVGDVHLLRDIGGGCGDAAIAVVQAMPVWEPAVHEGRKVAVRLNLPVEFGFKRQVTDEAGQFSIHWGKLHLDEITPAEIRQNLDEPILVRDAFGNVSTIRELGFLFEKGKKSASAEVQGNEPDKKMRKIAEQAVSGGTFTLNAVIQYGNSTLLVSRTFQVK